MAPPAEIRSQHDFQSLLKTATTNPPINFAAWLTDHRLAHLPAEEIILLREVIKDRWAKSDPESLLRFQDDQRDQNLTSGLKAWWKKDPQAVTEYVREKDSHDTWQTFLHIVALSDAKQAFQLFQTLPENMKRWVSDADGQFFFAMAKSDRDAFLKFALEDETQKLKHLTILAQTWLRDEFDWTVKILTQHEINPFQNQSHFSQTDWRKVPFDFLHKLPANWKDTILDPSNGFLRRDGFRWLSATSHPGLTIKQLKSVQESLGIDSYWLGKKDIPWIRKIVEEGNWLSDDTKSRLADQAVIRSHDHETLRPWIESLPPTINSKALKALDDFRNEKIRRTQTNPNLSNLKKLSDYLMNPHQQQRFSMRDWTAPEIQSFHDEIREISPEKAARLFKSVSIEDLPWRMQATLIPKILENPDLVGSNYLKFRIKKTAENYASHQPARAAEWAMALSDETLRILAAGIVADSWKKQNAEEAKAWVLTLPKPMRQRFGYEESE